MSLFPAYSEICAGNSESNASGQWLQNPSFDKGELTKASKPIVVYTEEPNDVVVRKNKRKHKKDDKSKKKRSKYVKDVQEPASSRNLSSDEFYVDKTAIRGYLSVETLYRPACPRYQIYVRGLHNLNSKKFAPKKFIRYHAAFKNSKKTTINRSLEAINADDDRFRKALFEEPTNVSKWIEYYNFKVDNPTEFEKYQNDRIQFELLEKAMKHNSKDVRILKHFLEAAKKVYPNDKVLELIDNLLDKDPNNFLLWQSFIYNRQSSMSQCVVPDILKIFEKSMRSMFTLKDDIIMLKLFKYCALFLRGCGLMEQFFGIIHLTLNLNIATTNQSLPKFYSAEHNNQLIEYEELVLKSGLPMNEIWLRIEKLRSAYNFLPSSNPSSSDPQRILVNEDICVFVYPLINRDYSFDLFILILKLLKYPFDSTAYKLLPIFQSEEVHEQDDVEFLLPLFTQISLDKSEDANNKIAFSVIFNMIKDLNSLPSYLTFTSLVSENYYQVLLDILIFGCNCFERTLKRSNVLLLLWLRLEHILVKIEMQVNENAKMTPEQKKKIRSRIKKILKKTAFQNNRNFYAEYAVLEYELDGFAAAENIFLVSMRQKYSVGDDSEADLYNLCVKYVEIAIREEEFEKGVAVIVNLVNNDLDQQNFDDDQRAITDVKKLLALQRLGEILKQRIDKFKNESLLQLEDVFYPNLLVNTIKAKLYLMLLLRKPKGLLYDEIGQMMKVFADSNPFHKFVREKLYELYFQLIKMKLASLLPAVVCRLLEKFVNEYPQNLTALSFCAFSESLSWFRIRSLLTKDKLISPTSIIFITASARYRFSRALLDRNKPSTITTLIDSNIELSESAFKIRIVNLLKYTIDRNPSQIIQNVLVWRLYLRALFDDDADTSLEKCKNVLYSALEICPWFKALYLDGAFFTPQLLSELMDIIIEKNLRIMALPEELEILRND